MALVVGVALAGSRPGEMDRREAIVRLPVTVPSSPGSSVSAGSFAPAVVPDGLDVDVPSGPDVPVRGGHVVVRGHVAATTDRVQILLQTRGATPIVVETVAATFEAGAATFQAALALPDPRPTGPAVVQVVAFDGRGRAQDFVLRRIVIEALEASPVGGEDGLMGGLVVDGE